MHLIRLLASQRLVQNIKHPILDGCVIYDLDELDAMVSRKMVTGDGTELIMGLRSLLRNLIGRYCYHYPAARRFKDEMVSVGILTIVKLVNSIGSVRLNRDIMYTTSLHVRRAIERMLNELQSNAAPSFTTQETLIREGKNPIFLVTDRETEADDKVIDSQENLYDILEVIANLRLDCELAIQIMDPNNWHLNDNELANKLGIERRRVSRCRKKLLNQCLLSMGEKE